MNKILFTVTMFGMLISGSAQAISITLNTGSESFNGLLLEGSGASNVGVIMFHGRGQNPNGDVVRQLRSSLNANGYTTLSIDNPVPTAGGKGFNNYLSNESNIEARVFSYFNSAVNSLVVSNSNIDKIIIGGFSLGSRFATGTAAAWEQGLLSINANVSLAGLFGIGMYDNISTDSVSTNPTTSSNINIFDATNNIALISSIPVLDLYGDLDSKSALFASERMNAYGGDALNYTQAALACPDFNNTAVFTRNQGVAVAYSENRCHQLRSAYLTEEDAVNLTNASTVLRGAADAPLETAVSDWAQNNVPLTAVPVPASVWLFASGLMGLVGFARRRKA